MEALGLNLGYLLVQIFNFAVVFVVLRAWVFTPILALLERRRESIAQGLEDARVASEARANAEKEAREIIAKAQAEATQKIREASERAEVAAREIQVEAEAQAAKAREAALAEAALERDRILADVRGQIAALAMSAAQRLIGEALDEKRQHVLLAEFFSGVKAGEVLVLEGKSFSGASAEVTSALPLTPDEQDTVKQDVLAKIGGQATVAFRVDPSILGGLVVRVGDKVFDGSVAGQLEDLRRSLH
ncbi:MAG: F0F1 ATP synthase subunit B [Anaerolineales bacterium]|nr:MAG: F0F1 ATP synthase subunit B [Anaerolineales bacterium]